MTRVIASIVVLALVSPALATIACDMACALTAPAGAGEVVTMTCHEHQAHHHTAASVKGTASGPCHEDDDSPAAVMVDSLQVAAMPAAAPASAALLRVDAALLHALDAASRSPGSPPRTSQLRI